MSELCPKCGAEPSTYDYKPGFKCGTFYKTDGSLFGGKPCLRRRLATVEAENERLRAGSINRLEQSLPMHSWDWGICWANGPQVYLAWMVFGTDGHAGPDIRTEGTGPTVVEAIDTLIEAAQRIAAQLGNLPVYLDGEKAEG